MNEVTVFRRFKSKQGVLVALGRSLVGASAGFAVAASPDPADTRGTLRALARQETEQAAAVGLMVMRLALDARFEPEVAEVMSETPGQNRAGLVAYLRERQEAGDLRSDLDAGVMAEAFFSLTALAVMTRQVLGEPDEYELSLAEAGDQLFELFWSGVSARHCGGGEMKALVLSALSSGGQPGAPRWRRCARRSPSAPATWRSWTARVRTSPPAPAAAAAGSRRRARAW